MQNLDPKTIQMIQIAENALARIHDEILTRYIVETLLTKGSVNIEEAQFFNELSKKILNESSHLFIPSAEQLTESLMINLEEEAKVLVDPETGDKFVYYPDTGELVPATDEDVAGVEDSEDEEDEEKIDELKADAAEDEAKADEDKAEEEDLIADEDEEEAEEDPAAQVSEDDVDVSASCASKDKKEIKESEEANEKQEAKEELNENELLVKQLLSTLKEL